MMQTRAPRPPPPPPRPPPPLTLAARRIQDAFRKLFNRKGACNHVVDELGLCKLIGDFVGRPNLAILNRQLFHEDLLRCQLLIQSIKGCEQLFDLSNARGRVFGILALCKHIGDFVGRTPSRLPISSLMGSGKRIFYCPRICKVLEDFLGHDLTMFGATFGCDDQNPQSGRPDAPSKRTQPSVDVVIKRILAKQKKNRRDRRNKTLAQANLDKFMPKNPDKRLNKKEKRLFAKQLKDAAIVRIQTAVRIRQAKRRVWTLKLRHQMLSG